MHEFTAERRQYCSERHRQKKYEYNNNNNKNNKPDIIVRDNKKGARMSTDVVIPGDRNVMKKGA